MKLRILLFAAAVLNILLILLIILPPFYPTEADFSSKRIYDRNGILIREILSDEEGVSVWTTLDSIPSYTLQTFIFKEDKRFHRHWGVDIAALMRSVFLNMKERRIVSGASTITMQVCRMIFPIRRYPVILRKAAEILLSLKMELWKSKDDILELYMNRAYFGNMLYGIESASRMYFAKPAAQLSLKESAILACVLQAPSIFNPYEYEEMNERADMLLDEMMESGIISAEQNNLAKAESPDYMEFRLAFSAPHFTDMVLASGMTDGKDIHTTLDIELQEYVNDLVKTTIEQFSGKDVNNAAVMVMDARTGDILAMSGSADYFNNEIMGQYNAVFGIRSPGSSLKPFTYALALMNGYSASSIIIDEPVYFKEPYGDYKPENYDMTFHGPVSMRTALACSYNVPAVKVLNDIGYTKLYELLTGMGFPVQGKPEQYGLAITLGSYCVRLYDLVRAYTVFPNMGIMTVPRMLMEDSITQEKILPDYAAYIISDILSDNDARIPAFGSENPFKLPFYAGVKTGTSKNYKDNFAVGFTDRYVVGVWVGNNDQKPMRDVSGITGAGALFRNVMIALREKYRTGSRPAMPESVERKKACAKSGELAGTQCPDTYMELFPTDYKRICSECGAEDHQIMEKAYIDYPDEGDIFVMDNDIEEIYQQLGIRLKNISEGMIVIIDGKSYIASDKILWQLSRGIHSILLEENGNITDSISFEVR